MNESIVQAVNMEWLQVMSLFLANAGLIVWFRAESRNDWRHMDNKVDANHKETKEIVEAIRKDMNDFHTRLALQDLEFKQRLCAIEEGKHAK